MNLERAFEIVDTPNPDEEAFVTYHDQETLITTKTRGDNGWPLKDVTLYKNWFLREGGRVNEKDDSDLYGNYIFIGKKAKGGVVAFSWGKNKSEEDKRKPFETWTTQGNHYWHGVLFRVDFFQDKNFPISTNGQDGGIILAGRMYDRIVYLPPVSEGTTFTHKLFFSATKFRIPKHRVPIPHSVQWNYHDSRGSFPECLHPKLVFPPMQSAFASYSTGGGAVSAFGAANGQSFPETNFTERLPYILSDKQEQVELGWIRHQIKVSPPLEETENSRQ